MMFHLPLLLLLSACFQVSYETNTTATKSGVTSTSCPTWFHPNRSQTNSSNCTCGSSLDEAVNCNQQTKEVGVISCYAMTYNESTGAVVGACPYGCIHRDGYKVKSPYYTVPNNESQLNNDTCGLMNRTGQLCGRCREGFATGIYSHALNCVLCTESHWAKYIILAYVPATVFFIIVIVFRISATTPNMYAFVTVCQAFSTPSQMRIILAEINLPTGLTNPSGYTAILIRFVFSTYAIWNVDFLRAIIPAFCISKHLNTIQVIVLDFAVAFYPLVLITLSYGLVKLHSRGYRFIVCIWKPFQFALARFRRQTNTKNSLVEAFATFILLSYVKILGICTDILMTTRVYNSSGHLQGTFLYYDATMPYFGVKHLGYAIPALLILLVFIFLPLVLLLIYPLSCFQKFLNKFNIQWFALHTFMDAFQGGYKDGTDGTRDCRYFAAVYLIVRVLMFLQYNFTASVYSTAIAGIILICTGVVVAVIQPYKRNFHNILDTVLIAVLAVWYLSYAMIGLGFYQKPIFLRMAYTLFIVVTILPMTGAIIALLYVYCYKKHSESVRKVYWMLRRQLYHNAEFNDDDHLPHRMEHPEDYTEHNSFNIQSHSYGTIISDIP